MTWFDVTVTWEGDNEYRYAIEAATEDEARETALARAPDPAVTVAPFPGVPDDVTDADYDAILPAWDRAGTPSRFQATFVPQAWQNDYAIRVDPKGDTVWDISTQFLLDSTLDKLFTAFARRDYARDDLRFDPAAPSWVREWQGPFEVDLEDEDVEEIRVLADIYKRFREGGLEAVTAADSAEIKSYIREYGCDDPFSVKLAETFPLEADEVAVEA